MKHVAFWAGWWVALFWLWLLLVGEWNREQIVAAAIAGAVAASVAEFARTRTAFDAPFPVRLLRDVPQTLGMVFVDFMILSWVLLRSLGGRRVVRGELVTRELPPGSWATKGVGSRAWTVLFASYSPNAYVVDVDPGAPCVVLHDLVPNRASEKPA